MAQSSTSNRLTTNDALDYLRTVKARFGDRKDVYDQFLQIMKEFKSSMVNTDGVIQRVKALFVGHRDLILGFNTFLPKGYEIRHDFDEEERPQIEFDQAISYVNKIKARFQNQEPVYKTFLEILNAYRKGQKSIKLVFEEVSNLFHGERDLLMEFKNFLPDAMSVAPGIHNPDSYLPQQVGMMHRGQSQFQGGQHLLGAQFQRARTGHAYGYAQEDARRNQRKISRRDQEEQFARKTLFSKELGWMEKMKKKVPNMEAFYDFIRIATLWHLDILTLQEFNQITDDFFKKLGPIGAELQDDFQQFLFKIVNMEIDVESTGHFANLGSQQAVAGDILINNNSTYKRMVPSKDKYLTRPFSDLDHSNCERVTVSYVKLPEDYPQLKCSGQDDLCRQVLNQTWVNVVSGSEDFSFRNFRKNQYEEALFRAEDDHHEIDVAIEQIKATKKSLENILERLQQLPVEERDSFRLALTELEEYQWAVLDRVYDMRGRELVAMLRENPWGALPKVLKRTEQKHTELSEIRAGEMMSKWRTIFQQNFSRSLDHRSFYFKQTDKKNLNNRTLAMEIKEQADARLNDPVYLKTLCMAGHWVEKVAKTDRRLEFDTPEVFEDMYQVIRWGLECHCKGEVGNQMLKFWIEEWECLLQVPHRSFIPLSADEIEDDEDDEEEEEEEEVDQEGERLEDDAVISDTEKPTSGTPLQNITHGSVQNEESTSQVVAGGVHGEEVEDDDIGGIEQNGGQVSRAGLMEVDGGEVVCENVSVEEEANGDVDIVAPPTPEDTMDEEIDDQDGEPSATDDIMSAPEDETLQGSIPVYVQAGVAKGSYDAVQRSDVSNSIALYTTDHFYVMARLCEFLFQRLKTGRQLCRKEYTGGNGDSSMNGGNGNGDLFEERHTSLMTMLHEFVKGNMEGSVFEDKCRILLGQNSYLLFTLDKLVQRLCKQMQLIIMDDSTMRCQALHRYEKDRSDGFNEEVYFLNVQAAVAETDPLFRFCCLDGYTVDVTLMDYFKTSVKAAVADVRNYDDINLSGPEQQSVEESISKHSSRFLCRTSRNQQLLQTNNDESIINKSEEIFQNFRSKNNLQIKINPSTFKRVYVQGTEDVGVFLSNKRRKLSVDPSCREIKQLKMDSEFQKRLEAQIKNTQSQFVPQQHQDLGSFQQLENDAQVVGAQFPQNQTQTAPLGLSHNQQLQEQFRQELQQQQQQILIQQQQQQQQLQQQQMMKFGGAQFDGSGL